MKNLFILLFLIIINNILFPAQNDTRGISVIAKNKNGAFESVKLYDKIHAVLIAIDNYPAESGLPVLKYPVNDAEGLREVLNNEYNFYSITFLYNNKATKSNIINKLTELNKNTFGDNDALLIFFAGHGITKKMKGSDFGYIIPYDGSKDEMLNNIDMGYLRESISKQLKPKHIFYIFDSCYSGTLFETRGTAEKSHRDLDYLKAITGEPVIMGFTAGTDKQAVLDGGPFGHSVFTGRLIEELKKTDDYITAKQIIDDVTEKVFIDAKDRHLIQTPQGGTLYGQGDFVFIPNILTKQKLSDETLEKAKEELVILNKKLETANTEKNTEIQKSLEVQKKILEQKVIEQENEKTRLQDEAEKRKKQDEEAKKNYNASEEELSRIKLLINQKQKELSSETNIIYGMLNKANEIKKQIENIDKEFENNRINFIKNTNSYYDRLINETKKNPKGEFEKSQEYDDRIKNEVNSIEERRKKDLSDYNIKIDSLKDKSLAELKNTLSEITANNKLYDYPDSDYKAEVGTYQADDGYFDVNLSILATYNKDGKKNSEWTPYNFKWQINRDKAKTLGSGDYKKLLIKQLKSGILEYNGNYINEPNHFIIIDPVSKEKLLEEIFYVSKDYVAYIKDKENKEKIAKENKERINKENEDKITKEKENQEKENRINSLDERISFLEESKNNLIRNINLNYIRNGSYFAHAFGWSIMGTGFLLMLFSSPILGQFTINPALISSGAILATVGLFGGIAGIILSSIDYGRGKYIIESIDNEIDRLINKKQEISISFNFDYNFCNKNLFFACSLKF